MKTKKKLVTPEVTSEVTHTRLLFKATDRYESVEMEIELHGPYRCEDAPYWTVGVKDRENRNIVHKLGESIEAYDDHKRFSYVRDKTSPHGKRGQFARREFASFDEAHTFAEQLATKVITYKARMVEAEKELTEALS